MMWKRALILPPVIKRFATSRSGAGAVEFAIVFPILLVIYICSFELTIGLSISKRVARAGAAVADIVTQQQAVSPSWLQDMPSVAKSILVPYSSTGMALKITAVQTDNTGKGSVTWSWAQDNSRPYSVQSNVNLPSELQTPNSFYIRTEFLLPYPLTFTPTFLPGALRTITIKRTYYYRQRQGDAISCSLC